MRVSVLPFRMHTTPTDMAYQAMTQRMYPQPAPAFLYGMGAIETAADCPPGTVWCPNENGDPNCSYNGCASSGIPNPNAAPTCVDFYTWTSQLQMENCDIYEAGTSDDVACNARNNAKSIAIQQIQEAYGDCIPPGLVISVDPSSGNWSASVNGQVGAQGNVGGANQVYGSATAPPPTPVPIVTPTTVTPVSTPVTATPAPTYGGGSLNFPSGAVPLTSNAPQQPTNATPILSTAPTNAVPLTPSSQTQPATGDSTILGIDSNTFMLVAAGLGLLLLMGRK